MSVQEKEWEKYLESYYNEFVKLYERPVSIGNVTNKIRMAFLNGFLRGQQEELRNKIKSLPWTQQ